MHAGAVGRDLAAPAGIAQEAQQLAFGHFCRVADAAEQHLDQESGAGGAHVAPDAVLRHLLGEGPDIEVAHGDGGELLEMAPHGLMEVVVNGILIVFAAIFHRHHSAAMHRGAAIRATEVSQGGGREPHAFQEGLDDGVGVEPRQMRPGLAPGELTALGIGIPKPHSYDREDLGLVPAAFGESLHRQEPHPRLIPILRQQVRDADLLAVEGRRQGQLGEDEGQLRTIPRRRVRALVLVRMLLVARVDDGLVPLMKKSNKRRAEGARSHHLQ